MYRAVVRYYHGYDYRSLYKTVIFSWRETTKAAKADLHEELKNNFYNDGYIEQGEVNE